MGKALVCMLLALPLAVACQVPGPVAPEHEAERGSEPLPVQVVALKRIVDSLSIAPDSIRLYVDKRSRLFHVMAGSEILKSYPCVLGENPVGDKFMQGDRRTPEGTFTFRDKYPHREWHKFVWVDYPNAESWKRFKERKRSKEIPESASIGGEIGIHGVPDGMDHWIMQGADWTWGCIALRNADLDEIYPYIKPKVTMIVIVP
jgi:murein L,D-transpeptidase YafK